MNSLFRPLLFAVFAVFLIENASTALTASPTVGFVSMVHLHTGAEWLAEIDLTGIFHDGPLVPPSRPWYDGLLSNRVVRILLFFGILGIIKSVFGSSSKNSTPPPPVRPATLPPPPAAVMQTQPVIVTSASQGQWIYQSNNQEIGPFDDASLRQMRNAGVITTSTRIRRANGGSWINYADAFGN